MKTVNIIIPSTLNPNAVSLADVWKGNIAESVAGLEEWLGGKTAVEVTDMAVLGLFRLAHATGHIYVQLVEFRSHEGISMLETIAKDGRISHWHASVLDVECSITSELLSLRRQHVRTLAALTHTMEIV